jgi:hypothetical protein
MAGKIQNNIIEGLRALQQRQFDFTVEQTFTIVQGKMAERLQSDVANIAARYDGTAIDLLGAKVQHLADIRVGAMDALVSVRKGVSQIVDAREYLTQMREAALAGNASAFDAAQAALETKITSATLDSSNLVGQLDYGVVGARTISVDLGDLGSAHFATQAIGSRYRLDIAGVSGGEPDLAGSTLMMDGVEVSFASLTFVSRTGDQIEFSDGTTTHTATLKPGGVGVASAWIYEHLATVAGRNQAIADVDAGLAKLTQLEAGYRNAEGQINSATKSMQTTLSVLSGAVNSLTEAELTERGALVAAAQAKFDASVLTAALMGKAQRARIQMLFEQPKSYDKGLFDILRGE